MIRNEKNCARLHHIGVVVKGIEASAKIFEQLGLTLRTEPEPDPIQKVVASFVNLLPDREVYVELIEPTDVSSPVTNFLNKRGGGLHHLCFEVDNLEDMTTRLTREGFKMVTAPVECEGFDRTFGCKEDKAANIAFFMMEGKLLIELLQRG